MTGPDRIWVTQEDHGASWSGSFRAFRASDLDHGDDYPEYIRRDPAVLAALPDVQSLIRHAVDADRGARRYYGGTVQPVASAPTTPPPPKPKG